MSEVSYTIDGSTNHTLAHEDVVKYIIEFLRKPPKHSFSDYGYDLYVNTVLILFFQQKHNSDHHYSANQRKQVSPLFMDACWELCRRGILRPDTKDSFGQGTSQGAGYSVTAFGKKWLAESTMEDYVPTEPDRFSLMLAPYAKIFGDAFKERAQEAVICYNAHAYMACCAMVGAAAELILFKVADSLGIETSPKSKAAELTKSIIRKSKDKGIDKIEEELGSHKSLIAYWRDDAMHSKGDESSGNKAYIALAMLLKFAIFSKEKWSLNNSEPTT